MSNRERGNWADFDRNLRFHLYDTFPLDVVFTLQHVLRSCEQNPHLWPELAGRGYDNQRWRVRSALLRIVDKKIICAFHRKGRGTIKYYLPSGKVKWQEMKHVG